MVVNIYLRKYHNEELLESLNLRSQSQRLWVSRPWKGSRGCEFLISTPSNYNAHGLKIISWETIKEKGAGVLTCSHPCIHKQGVYFLFSENMDKFYKNFIGSMACLLLLATKGSLSCLVREKPPWHTTEIGFYFKTFLGRSSVPKRLHSNIAVAAQAWHW